MSDTIFALATPPGRGAIAILRLSGSATDTALAALGLAVLTISFTLDRRTRLRRG